MRWIVVRWHRPFWWAYSGNYPFMSAKTLNDICNSLRAATPSNQEEQP